MAKVSQQKLRSLSKTDEEQLQAKLNVLAVEIASDLSAVNASRSKELLSDFVSDLFLAVADQRRREKNRQKQAEGIAAAKAKGVRFGRAKREMPENFAEVCRAWRNKQMTLQEAADACELPRSTFYDAAMQREHPADDAV